MDLTGAYKLSFLLGAISARCSLVLKYSLHCGRINVVNLSMLLGVSDDPVSSRCVTSVKFNGNFKP